MSYDTAIIDLKRVLPEDSWSWVIPALRRTPLIWKALQNPDFRGLANTRIGSQPTEWTPIQLALLTLPDDLNIEDAKNPPPEILRKARLAFKNHSQITTLPDLSAAALLALGLFAHLESTTNWCELPKSKILQTSYTCVFGLLADSLKLLQELPIDMGVRAMSGNPLPPKEQYHLIQSWLEIVPADQKVCLLREINRYYPQFTAPLAEQWVTQPYSLLAQPQIPNFLAGETLLSRMREFLHNAEISYLGEQVDNNYRDLQTNRHLAHEFYSLSLSLEALSAPTDDDCQSVIAAWQARSNHSPIQAASLALNLIERGQLAKAEQLLERVPHTEDLPALYFLAKARLAFQKDDRQTALQNGLSSLENFEKTSGLTVDDLIALADLFLEINQIKPAIKTAERAFEIDPNNAEIAHLIAGLQTSQGNHTKALYIAHLAIALSPDQLVYRRTLAIIFEKLGDWPGAFAEWNAILEKSSAVDSGDLRSLAVCALHMEQPEKTADICRQILALAPDDGLTHAIYGKALTKLGDQEAATTCYKKGVQLAPEESATWLALAQSLLDQGQANSAIKHLRKAAQSVPNDPEILLALGEAYLQNQSRTQALTTLREAANIVQEGSKRIDRELHNTIILKLGEVLYSLGHFEQALELLDPAGMDTPDPVHRRLYAQTLLAVDRNTEALPLLADLAAGTPEDAEILLEYARTILALKQNPQDAIQPLKQLIKLNPKDGEAQALLAEAFYAAGDYAPALKVFRHALTSDLQNDPDWYARLSLGMGKTALQLDQPETALAALLQGQSAKPNNLEIAQTLFSAYLASHLNDKALEAARSALEIDPQNPANLLWFIEKAIQLSQPEEAAATLKRASQLEPNNCEIKLQLAALQYKLGESQAAQESYNQILALENLSSQSLITAAQGLQELGDLDAAHRGYQQALQQYRALAEPPIDQVRGVLVALVKIDLANEEYEPAYDRLEEAIDLAPDDADLLVQKTHLLNLMGQADQALEHLQQSLEIWPENAALLEQAARTYRERGELALGLEHALKAVAASQSPAIPTLALAAELARAALQTNRARKLLTLGDSIYQQQLASDEDESLAFITPDYLDYFCLQAESALEDGEEISAAEALTPAILLNSNHPRVLALQARLAARQGDFSTGQQILATALTQIGDALEPPNSDPASLIALANTAMEFRQWSAAIFMLQTATNTAPNEPLTYIKLAGGLVQRAEYQRLCKEVAVSQHAPGESSLADFSFESFEQAILMASQLVTELETNSQFSCEKDSPIAAWLARGQAAFHPNLQHAQALIDLPPSEENYKAFIAALRHSGEADAAVRAGYDILKLDQKSKPQHPGLLGEIALALATFEPALALKMAQATVETSTQQAHPDRALHYALQSKVARLTGKTKIEQNALKIALQTWEDEVQWQARYAALVAEEDPAAAIEHLEQAIHSDPQKAELHLQLGETLLAADRPKDAIKTLENALRSHPDSQNLRLTLARAYHAAGDLAQTANCAQNVIEQNPQCSPAHLLLAEVAFQNENFQKALQHCEQALEINPEDSNGLILQSRVLAALDKPEQALNKLEKALPHIPRSIPMLLEHVRLVAQAQGETAALNKLEHLAAKNSNDPAILAAYAEALARNNQPKSALQAAQKALLSPQANFDSYAEAQLFSLLGRLLRRDGQLDQAIQQFEQAIERDPKNIEHYLELGRVYQSRRQYEQALQTLQRAGEVTPNDHRLYLEAGQVLKEAKDYINAEAMLEKAVQLAPDNVNIRRQLASVVALNLIHNRKSVRKYKTTVGVEHQ